MKPTDILRDLVAGRLTVEEAAERLAPAPAEADLGSLRVDLDRPRRCGIPEVIYAPGKTVDQVVRAIQALRGAGQPAFVSRLEPELEAALRERFPEAVVHPEARIFSLGGPGHGGAVGRVAVISAGTSDLPVAEEAAVTAEWLGARVLRVPDVGVAGLHRLTGRLEAIRAARVLVVVAGMEGALPSVVGGLVDRPVIAVPTSVGYGTNLQGVTALLAMMNSCVPGITVVNVDNGFGAGVAAALINRLGEPG